MTLTPELLTRLRRNAGRMHRLTAVRWMEAEDHLHNAIIKLLQYGEQPDAHARRLGWEGMIEGIPQIRSQQHRVFTSRHEVRWEGASFLEQAGDPQWALDPAALVEAREQLMLFAVREPEIFTLLLEGHTAREIGKRLGLTEGRISQRRKAAATTEESHENTLH